MFPKVIGTQKYFLRKVPCVQVYPLHALQHLGAAMESASPVSLTLCRLLAAQHDYVVSCPPFSSQVLQLFLGLLPYHPFYFTLS